MNGEGKISCMKDTKYQRSVKGCMHLYCSVHSYLLKKYLKYEMYLGTEEVLHIILNSYCCASSVIL